MFCTFITWCPNSYTRYLGQRKQVCYMPSSSSCITISRESMQLHSHGLCSTVLPRSLPLSVKVLLWFNIVKCVTSHLSGLNSTCHHLAHFPSWSIFFCNFKQPASQSTKCTNQPLIFSSRTLTWQMIDPAAHHWTLASNLKNSLHHCPLPQANFEPNLYFCPESHVL